MPQASQVYTQLSAIMNAVEDRVFDLYQNGRDLQALQTATALKDYATRFKVAGDVIDMAVERLRAAATAAAQTAGDAAIAKQIEAYAAQLGSAQPDRAVATDTKAARPGSCTQLLDGVSASLVRTGGHTS